MLLERSEFMLFANASSQLARMIEVLGAEAV